MNGSPNSPRPQIDQEASQEVASQEGNQWQEAMSGMPEFDQRQVSYESDSSHSRGQLEQGSSEQFKKDAKDFEDNARDIYRKLSIDERNALKAAGIRDEKDYGEYLHETAAKEAEHAEDNKLAENESMEDEPAALDNRETLLERNRNIFNSATKRLLYLTQAYPDNENEPAEIANEKALLETKRARLAGGFGMHVLGVGEARDGAIVSKFTSEDYNSDLFQHSLNMLHLGLKEKEVGSFDEKSIQLPKVNLESMEERIANISSDFSELRALGQEIEATQRFADMDTYMKLSDLNRQAIDNWTERTKAEEQAELKSLQTKLAEIESKIQQANANYQKLTIFQKAWKKMNHSDNRGALETERKAAKEALDDFISQKHLTSEYLSDN